MNSESTALTQSEFARQAGVSRQAVSKAVADGRLPAAGNKVRMDGTTPTELWEATSDPTQQLRRDQIKEAKATPPANGDQLPAIERLGAALKLETYKLQKARAEIANIELDKAAGALVERAEVELVLADFGTTLRGLMEGLPIRLQPVHRGDHHLIAEIEAVAADILTEMSEHMERKTNV